jgi:hypothetical protein
VRRLPDAGNLRFSVAIEIRRRATRCRNVSFIENFTSPLCPVKALNINARWLASETGNGNHFHLLPAPESYLVLQIERSPGPFPDPYNLLAC